MLFVWRERKAEPAIPVSIKTLGGENEMAEEREETREEETEERPPKKKGRLKLVVIVAVVLAILGGGGFFAYTKFFKKGGGAVAEVSKEEMIRDEQPALFNLEPFVVNLADRGRFLKVTMKLELQDVKFENYIKDKTPHIRDAIITLLSSKTSESISTPEGKFQLKDELLMRANAAIGRDIFKNIYFTDFVMQ